MKSIEEKIFEIELNQRRLLIEITEKVLIEKRSTRIPNLPLEVTLTELRRFYGADSAIFDKDEDFKSNGWDYNWWIEGVIKGEKVAISGSGYYGNNHIEVLK